jgi:hypothetical protein
MLGIWLKDCGVSGYRIVVRGENEVAGFWFLVPGYWFLVGEKKGDPTPSAPLRAKGYLCSG